MVALSPALSLVAALIAAPLVLVTRVLQVRVRQAERENRAAVGAVNTRLQERSEKRRSDPRVRPRAGVRRRLPARCSAAGWPPPTGRSFYSALYTPTSAILSAVAVGALLAVGTQPAFGATSISLGNPDGVPAAPAALLPAHHGARRGVADRSGRDGRGGAHLRHAGAALPTSRRRGAARRTAACLARWPVVLSDVEFGYAQGSRCCTVCRSQVRGRRARRAGGAHGRGEDERAPSDRGPVPAVGGQRPRGRPRPGPAR